MRPETTAAARETALEGCAQVTLVVPWLSVEEQPIVFPDQLTFSRPEQQEAHLREVSAASGLDPGGQQSPGPGSPHQRSSILDGTGA